MSPGETAGPVWLSRHVHICRLGARFIVLNVARDEYLSVEGAAAECLSDWLPACPDVAARPNTPGESQHEAGISGLVAQGVLTRSIGDAREVPVTLYGPSTADRALDSNHPGTLRLQTDHVLVFLWSLISTASTLQFGSLQAALNSLAVRKLHTKNEPECGIERAADLIAIFRRLRSVTFAGHRRCLLHAMTLMKFLSHYGIQATFVMGVKVEPWAAHSWVELGCYTLDGTPEQARFYHRILVI